MYSYRTGSRYLADRRDLNRSFPGNAGGSVASIIAYAVFSKVLNHCDALVDLHEAFDVVSPLDGEVIGMAVPQAVLSGYGLFHLAWHNSDTRNK